MKPATVAAQEFHDCTGNWDVRGADPELVEQVLVKQVLAEHSAGG